MRHERISSQVQEREQDCSWIELLPFVGLYFLYFDNQLGIECLRSAIHQPGACGGVIGVVKARACARAMANRPGPILPLIGDLPDAAHALLERHICIDTTASGGNAQLLAEVADP